MGDATVEVDRACQGQPLDRKIKQLSGVVTEELCPVGKGSLKDICTCAEVLS